MAEELEKKAEEAMNEQTAAPENTGRKKKKGKKRKILKRVIWTVVILLVIGVVVWSVYSKLKADYQVTYDPYTATTGSISNSLSFTGSMQLVNSATYTASSDATVREVYAAAGDQVSSGDRLVRLSTGELVKAEFDGTVSALEVAKGDEVKAGDTLATVADFDHMKVSVRVGESDISQVSVGQACKVSVSSAGASFDAKIDKIDYASYTGNNVAYYTSTVYVDTSGAANLWPGMQATVTITLDEAQNVTVLKMDALSTARDNTAFVYKETESGEMEQVAVTVGVSNGNYVEIKDGVSSGETVYKIAEKEEQQTGLAGLFSSLFSSTQVNRPSNRNWSGGSGDMPDFSNMPDMSNMPSGFPGQNSQRNSNGGGAPGGTRGN